MQHPVLSSAPKLRLKGGQIPPSRCQAIRALTPAVEHQVVIVGPGDNPRDCMVLAQMEITLPKKCFSFVLEKHSSK
jgi:hypothetical protein